MNYANSILRPQPNCDKRDVATVTAIDRHDLIETVEYLQQPKRLAFQQDGAIIGYLLDGDAGERPYMDSEIVITRITDAYGASDPLLTMFRKTQMNLTTVTLVMTNEYSNRIIETRTKFAVMNHFRISGVWSEKSDNDGIFFQVMFEKVDLQNTSWWTPGQMNPPDPRKLDVNVSQATCLSCGEGCPQIYAEAWLCLNGNCQFFWTQNDDHRSLAPPDLTFDDDFLRKRHYYGLQTQYLPQYSIYSDIITSFQSIQLTGQILANLRTLWKGMICPSCFLCNSRTSWHEWKCRGENCRFSYANHPGHVSLRAIIERPTIHAYGHPNVDIEVPEGDDLPQGPLFRPLYRIDKIPLHGDTIVTLLTPTEAFNTIENGPDSIWTSLTEAANNGQLNLRRERLKEDLDGLTSYFFSYFGAQYDYLGPTIPFNQAPHALKVAHDLINGIGEQELHDFYLKPNATQVLGYWDGMSLPFHYDGEDELGDTTSIMHLGGDATMSIRLKRRYWDNENVFGSGGQVITGAYNWRRVLEIKTALDAGEDIPPPPPTPWAKPGQGYGRNHDKIRPETVLPLRHGSMVIIQGTGFHQFYEYKVDMRSKMCLSVTTRHVDPRQHDQNFEKRANRLAGHVYSKSQSTSKEQTSGEVEESDGGASEQNGDEEEEDDDDGAEEAEDSSSAEKPSRKRKRTNDTGRIRNGPVTPAEEAQMRRLKAENKSWKHIAEALGTGRNIGSLRTIWVRFRRDDEAAAAAAAAAATPAVAPATTARRGRSARATRGRTRK